MGGIFGEGMTIVPEQAFKECTSLTKISQGSIDINDPNVEYNCLYIPSVTTIGKQAFFGCDNLTEIIFGNGLKFNAKQKVMIK